jgi:hypothetical protein
VPGGGNVDSVLILRDHLRFFFLAGSGSPKNGSEFVAMQQECQQHHTMTLSDLIIVTDLRTCRQFDRPLDRRSALVPELAKEIKVGRP